MGIQEMIETNCWMPDELYNDWLIERGFEPEEQSFIGFDLFSSIAALPPANSRRGNGFYEFFGEVNGVTLLYEITTTFGAIGKGNGGLHQSGDRINNFGSGGRYGYINRNDQADEPIGN